MTGACETKEIEPQLWQVGNLPHIAVYRIDGNAKRRLAGRFRLAFRLCTTGRCPMVRSHASLVDLAVAGSQRHLDRMPGRRRQHTGDNAPMCPIKPHRHAFRSDPYAAIGLWRQARVRRGTVSGDATSGPLPLTCKGVIHRQLQVTFHKPSPDLPQTLHRSSTDCL